jgi:glyoxylase I family protein
MALQSFSHLGICVADLDRSTRFYVDVLGFRELVSLDFDSVLAATMEREGAFTSRMLARDDVRIELLAWHDGHVSGDGARRAMDARGVTHLCFRVDDATELFEIARRAGGDAWPGTLTSIAGMGMGGTDLRTVYLTDPDGVRIECISGMPDLSQA